MNLTGNCVLITGGATGIGFALAELFLSSGNEVIICGRREEKLLEAQTKHPELTIRVCDVADKEEQIALFNWAVDQFPALNILINNAGIQCDIDLTKGIDDLSECNNEIAINFEAPVRLSALFIPHLVNQEEPAIINVTSGLAFTPMLLSPVYCATKAALHTFTVVLREQLLKTGIKVFEVIPPMVDTELNAVGRKKRKVRYRGISSEEFAEVVIKGLENNEFEICCGSTEQCKTASRAELERKLLALNP